MTHTGDSVVTRPGGARATTLHGCAVQTIDPADPTFTKVPCGQPATWWTAPSGNEYFVCPDHQDSFEVPA